ncbi:Protein argonaute [Conoideocrella luteorostrata]|uniref:Protein argonaute n=1 Tax=Conoideocrella luteorostrata TaxID=1105319 RepID=A0AAJ0CVD4_9HYPO|nr:Protein argonaute [Conoideocrella luteorostrata]
MSSRGRSPTPSAGGRSGPPSPSRSGPGPSGWVAPMGHDPARSNVQRDKGNTRMELPPDAYVSDTKKGMFALRGNKFNSEGSKAIVEVNQYRMKKFNFSQKIYQYDVIISPDTESKGALMKKLWTHSATKAALNNYRYSMWIFDGRKLAWAPGKVDKGELRFMVDLDEGRQPPGATGRESNKFYVTLRVTTEVHIDVLSAYLDQKCQFNTSVQVALNFMDHLLRQRPSQHMTAIKRSFYNQNSPGRPLLEGRVLEVHKGTYASIRMSHNLTQGGTGLALNADIANTVFWTGPQPIDQLARNFLTQCDKKWKGMDVASMINALRPVRNKEGKWQSSDAFKQLRKMRKLKFTVQHANRSANDKVYTLLDFAFDDKYGGEGGTAKMVTFDHDGSQISVADYYRKKYKAHLKCANLPLIYAGKGGFIPMEFAIIEPMQRYAFKLSPEQTAAMIKIAVTRPKQRREDIEKGVQSLQLQFDPYLKTYGVEFEQTFTKTEARILAPPPVNFRQGTADPKFSGRWDLRGKKFWKQNVAPLQNWAFIIMDGGVSYPQLQAFAKLFRTTFLGHGGVCPSDALLLNVPGNIKNDVAQAVQWAHKAVTEQRGYTQLLFVVVQHKNSPHYERLKKSADCRFGILSQVVNSSAVVSNNGQYHSNVCLKVNAKLGGATARTMPPWKSQTYFPKDRPTMVIGADISHGAPGGNSPSTAAMTMSVDRDANRYAAMVESNGYRVEMLTPANIHLMFNQLTQYWKAGHENGFPKHIIYFRDGVGEGQFAHVIDQEVREMRNWLQQKAPKMAMPKFTVIVATKRHHIRFFPQKGDKNGNALPGTLIEREVTHPFMWDFYMCSHVAIQGTARPVHYHVILDEMNVPVNDLQKMIYHQCYSYARSTTPVSLHPAVYYAHLAGARARCHENIAASEGPRSGGKGHEMIRDQLAKGLTMGGGDMRGIEAPPLLQLGGRPEGDKPPADGEMRQRDFFRGTMWYI